MTLLRTESFVPLTAAPAGNQRDFRVTIIPQTGQPPPFQPAEPLRSDAADKPAAGGNRHGEPRVSVQRDGDRVTSIRVQCSCGEVLDLACVYQEPAKSS